MYLRCRYDFESKFSKKISGGDTPGPILVERASTYPIQTYTCALKMSYGWL